MDNLDTSADASFTLLYLLTWLCFRPVSNSSCLDCNSSKVSVKRVGGAFGGKINRATPIAAATAVAADKFGHPVRTVLDLHTNMQVRLKGDVGALTVTSNFLFDLSYCYR
jgi:xanthine dehydrogenase molybdopterin-binding subunit B